MSRLPFVVEATAARSRARACTFQTLHGEVKTPVFMPVGTQATVKNQSFPSLKRSGTQVLLANTYHLTLRPGVEVFKKFGGIHSFMNWPGVVLTDSGGFQIFSLPDARLVSEEGAKFQSYVDGKRILLTPESSIEIQKAIGSDIMMVLDQCIPSTSDFELATVAMHRTHRWAQRGLEARGESAQALFGIIQGALFPELRRQSAEFLSQLPFDGLAIGGLAVGESKSQREDFTELTTEYMPADRPRYLMGVGTPSDLLAAVHRGVDMFDCIIPTSQGNLGTAFTSRGKMQLRRGVYKFSEEALDRDCACETCRHYSRAYLHHLVKTHEGLGMQLIGGHNIHFYHQLMAEIRQSIFDNTFYDFYETRRHLLSQSEMDHPVSGKKVKVKVKKNKNKIQIKIENKNEEAAMAGTENTKSTDIKNFLEQLNGEFNRLHTAKENSFWATNMGLEDQQTQWAEAEKQLHLFKQNEAHLRHCRKALAEGHPDPEETFVLGGWVKFFEKNIIEDEEAKRFLSQIVDLENAINAKKRNHQSGYTDPETGEFQSGSSNVLRMMLSTDQDERKRKAAYQGLLDIEDFVLSSGYIELIKLRNQFARALGYSDFMAYKCRYAEDMSKEETFDLIHQAVQGILPRWKETLRTFQGQFGEEVRQPWNFCYHTSGETRRELDPYFPFASSVERWIKSFEALGIDYQGATLTLDLLDRAGKYENGFMHGPEVSYFDDKGTWHPARINFTANASPQQVGSGFEALDTLFHEGGHAAHFSNVNRSSPVFSHEYPPTSMGLAETQSMFLDSLVGDGDWQLRYALDEKGNPPPMELIEKNIRKIQPLKPVMILGTAMVSEFEKRVYELPENQLSAETLKRIAREVEQNISGKINERPLLTVPHLLSFDSSCTYHGYLFALFGVYQTREFFLKKFGYIVDNPEVGPLLARHYWNPGNSVTFKDLIKSLTQKDLSPQALIDDALQSPAEVLQELRGRMQIGEGKTAKKAGNLNATIKIIHGRETIASSDQGILAMAGTFKDWINKNYPRFK